MDLLTDQLVTNIMDQVTGRSADTAQGSDPQQPPLRGSPMVGGVVLLLDMWCGFFQHPLFCCFL